MANRDIISNLLHPEVHPQRNGFDLSHRKILTAKAGELLPVLCEDCVPGDFFEMNASTLLRTFPLNTAAFMRAKLCFDFFFVPKTAIWSRYNDFISQRVDLRSSYVRGSAFEPNVTIDFLRTCVTTAAAPNSGSYSPIDSADCRTKILQLLGYGYIGGNNRVDWPSANAQKSLTALPIAGYNFIYNNYYRNPWRDQPNSNQIADANLDSVQCTTYATSLVDNVVDYDFVQMHYHQWYKDLFVGSLPNQQFGNISSVSVSVDPAAVQLNTPSVFTTNSSDLYGKKNSVDNLVVSQGSSGTGTSLITSSQAGTFDVLALRRAMALQKWKEYNMRAGYRNRAQQKAQYGEGMPLDISHELQFIDSFESDVMIDEVISTANTSSPSSGNGNLAEIAGKGIGFNRGHNIKFDVKVPGYIYCIAYVLPQADYDAVGFDKSLVRSEPFDHYLPAFQNIAMQPIQVQQINAQFGTSAIISNSVIGYAPNWYEYKSRVDKCYGAFMDYLIVDTTPSAGSPSPQKQAGSLAPWCLHRPDILNANLPYINTEAFYVNPRCLDHVFVSAADGYKETDQFMLNINFDVKAVRPMSVLGLPTI